jgi:hypothetical protein
VKLTRDQQDRILFPVVLASGHVRRTVCQHGNWASYPTVGTRMADLRDALRLDDPVLDALIESGAYRHPWNSPTDKERVACLSGS